MFKTHLPREDGKRHEKCFAFTSLMTWDLWTVPAQAQLADMRVIYDILLGDSWKPYPTAAGSLKYNRPATSQAICFLNTRQEAGLGRLRHLVIHEDHRSTAFP